MRFSASIEQVRPVSVIQMACTVCGAKAEASCRCGAPYLPAGERAKLAVIANPEKSDRAIADEIGVHRRTVERARSHGANAPPERVLGRDGKNYGAKQGKKKKPETDDEMPTEEEAFKSWQKDVYDQACLILEEMSGPTRRKFFAFLREKYSENFGK